MKQATSFLNFDGIDEETEAAMNIVLGCDSPSKFDLIDSELIKKSFVGFDKVGFQLAACGNFLDASIIASAMAAIRIHATRRGFPLPRATPEGEGSEAVLRAIVNAQLGYTAREG